MNELLQVSTALLLWMHRDVYVTLGRNKTRWLVKCGKTWPPALGMRKNCSPPEPALPSIRIGNTCATHQVATYYEMVVAVQQHHVVHGKIFLHFFSLLTNLQCWQIFICPASPKLVIHVLQLSSSLPNYCSLLKKLPEEGLRHHHGRPVAYGLGSMAVTFPVQCVRGERSWVQDVLHLRHLRR